MTDFKNKIDEIINDMKGRFRNPLILSFSLVWLYYHWRFVYEILTVDRQISVGIRGDYFKQYILDQGWSGMVGHPIIISFFSLICYYVIGVIAQFINFWLGKRLPAAVMAKFDTAKYELKTVTVKLRSKIKYLEEKETALTNENENLKSKFSQKESEALTTEKQLNAKIKALDIEIGEARALNRTIHDEKEQESKKREINEAENEMLLKEIESLKEKINVQNKTISLNKAKEFARYSTQISEIFPDGSQWIIMPLTKVDNWDKSFTIKQDHFVYNEEDVDTITEFKFDKKEKFVSFLLSNNSKGYFNVEVRLFFEDKGKSLLGIYGDTEGIRYKRVNF